MGTSAIFLIISGYVWEDNIFLSSAITEMLLHRYPNAYFSHYHYHLDTHHNNNRYCIPPFPRVSSVTEKYPACILAVDPFRKWISRCFSESGLSEDMLYIAGLYFPVDFFMTFLSITLQYIPQASGLRIRKTRMVFPSRSFLRSYIQFYQCFIIRKAWKMHLLRTEP